jgi:ligand-binding sensor domain-containing protein
MKLPASRSKNRIRFACQLLLVVIITCTPSVNAQWVQLTDPNGGVVSSITVKGSYLFVGTAGSGVFRSSDFGIHWTSTNAGFTNTSVWSIVAVGSDLFVGTYGAGVFLSTDNGSTWNSLGDELSQSYVLSLAIDAQNLYAGTLNGVFLLSADRLSWQPLNKGLTNVFVRTLAIHEGRIFAGTYGGGVFISSDRGISWTAKNEGLANPYVLSIAFLGSNVFAGTYGGVFRTNDSLTIWEPVDLEAKSLGIHDILAPAPDYETEGTNRVAAVLAPKAVYSLTVDRTDLYVGTYGMGVLRSVNGGQGWDPINFGLGNLDLNVLSIYGRDLYAGALDGQLWRLRLPDTEAGRRSQSEIPKHAVLDQNYPNPFNPTTVVSYQLSVASDVKLDVYDLLGRNVTTLVNEMKLPGRYSVRFDAKRLASGVYFYRLQAGGFVGIRQMVLLR